MEIQKSFRMKNNFNLDWKFYLDDIEHAERQDLDDSLWDDVILPHTPQIEDIYVCHHFQGFCWYRKHFTVDSLHKNKKIFIEFEAGMQIADVWINGKYKLTHNGGYLPFTIDVSEDILWDKENIIAIRLDNRDNGNIPPGRPLKKGFDFCYFGGLYRNAYINITDKLYITDAVYTGRVAGGGVFVTYHDVSKTSARLQINTHVINENLDKRQARIGICILDTDGKLVKNTESEMVDIPSGGDYTFIQNIIIDNPKLWNPDATYLYAIQAMVIDDNIAVDEEITRVGIRTVSCKKPEGFSLNGEPLKIRGVNRHHQYPYVGIAASDNAQYRDARKLKEAGFNFVRLSHYPQSTVFLDACDELGLMVMEPTPGWQWCKEGMFQEIVLQNIRDMIRRDRNHPCIVMWEVSLNETGTYWEGATDEFFHRCHVVAHEEYPGDQMLTAGDTMGRKKPEEVDFDVPFTEWDEETKTRPLKALPEKMGLDREYGDYEFGGHNSTTRVFRSDGETCQLQQAWNFQWSYNRNLSYPWSIGGAIWVGIDYNRGCCPDKPICNCGILDTFRLPKFAYYFYQSQRRPDMISTEYDCGPMVYIANNWIPAEERKKVVIYSNCEEIKLYLNGRLIETRKPDDGPDLEYVEKKIDSTVDYWLDNKDMVGMGVDGADEDEFEIDPLARLTFETSFDGGSCRRLDHAPFTFDNIIYECGELRAVGFIGGREAASNIRRTPEVPKSLFIRYDKCGKELKADGSDFIFVYAEIRDKNGTVVPDADNEVTFLVKGPGILIGATQVRAEAGIACVLLKSMKRAGEIILAVESDGLDIDIKKIISISP